MCSDRWGAAAGVQTAFPALRDRIRAELQPRNRVEAVLVDRIAALTWRLSRTAGLEIALLLMDYDAHEWERIPESDRRASTPGGGRPTMYLVADRRDPVGRGQSVAAAFGTQSRSLARLRRYETAALANLDKYLSLLREWQSDGAHPSPGEASPQ